MISGHEFGSIITGGKAERANTIAKKCIPPEVVEGQADQNIVFLTPPEGLSPFKWGWRFEPVARDLFEIQFSQGSVYDGLGIFDTMQHVKPDVQTVCVGLAASMGAFLLAAGAAGKRSSLQHSRIMIHQPLGGAQGQASDIRIQANEILFLKKRLNEELASRTGQPLERVQKDTDRDFFMSPVEAVNYGLIDKVIDQRPIHAV